MRVKIESLGLAWWFVPILASIAGCGPKPEHNANWYYYWEKDNVIPDLDRNGSPASRWDWSVDAANQGVFGASHGPSDGYVLTDLSITSPFMSPIRVIHKVRGTQVYIGAQTVFGVEQAAATAAHEKRHIVNYKMCLAPGSDTDRDGLPDSMENVSPEFFIIGDRDTYELGVWIHPGYHDYGDNEFIARQAEQAAVNALNKNLDWSKGGAQWGH
jgi:hypothetical protein